MTQHVQIDYWSDYIIPFGLNTNHCTWETPRTTQHLDNTFFAVERGGNIMLWVWSGLRTRDRERKGGRDPRRNLDAERTQPQTGRARVDEASSQGKAGEASSLSVLEWPSQSLNLNSKTNCRVSWREQSTNISFQSDKTLDLQGRICSNISIVPLL